MTIRKRLFWSNILMLVLPVVLSAGISYTILFLFTSNSPVDMERAFPNAFNIILKFRQTGDMEQLVENVEGFNQQFAATPVRMAVAEGQHLVYPPGYEERMPGGGALLHTVLSSEATGSMNINGVRYVIEGVGEYRIMLVDQQLRLDTPRKGTFINHMLLLLGVTVGTIIITNQLLTHLLTKRITGSLELLANGVNQLRDGHLEYRIAYKNKDEFTPVIEDFNEMAVQLQKLILRQQRDEESRKELLAGISHDLRTPLTSIKAYVEGLLDGVAEDYPTQLRYLGIIRNKAEDIDNIVDKLFLFSKLEIEEFPFYHEKLDLGEELTLTAQAVAAENGVRGLTVELTQDIHGVYVNADPVQLRNALANILENSSRYKNRENCVVQIGCQDKGSMVEVSLTDNGPGVPEESLGKLFNVFYREDPSRQNPSKGSGLGLAITSKIMHRMGGTIRAENAPQGGLRIILGLPKYQEEERKNG